MRINEGFSNTKIYYLVRDKYNITRGEVNKILRDNKLMVSNTHGGYRPGSGKGTKYLYEGIIYDSLSEFCFKLKYPFMIKNYKSFRVDNHNYTPDFYYDGVFYEIKSYKCDDFWGWNYEKVKNFDKKLVVVKYEEIIKIVDEIKNLYGSDYLNSYVWKGSYNRS